MTTLPVPIAALLLLLLQAQDPASGLPPASTHLADLDGDGALDVLAVGLDGTLQVRRNAGGRAFREVAQELPRVQVTGVLCTDLDHDGLPDLYLVSPGPDVALRGEGGGLFREATAELGLSEAGPGHAVERQDVDGDGLLDLVLHNLGSDVLFWARPDGRFERDAATVDGPSVCAEVALELAPASTSGAASGPAATLACASAGPSSALGTSAALPPASTTAPIVGIGLDARFVNDGAGEVGSADVADGSLIGADVSTASGDVTFSGATLRAQRAAFGLSAVASGVDASVTGGQNNTASGLRSAVSGGLDNFAQGIDSTVSGGGHNAATKNWSTVAGGRYNIASGPYASVSGGGANTASGVRATVPGGYRNTALGNYSFAAGRRAKANHNGSFVWGDSANVDKASGAADQFNVYAEGGARIFAVGQATPSMVVDSAGNVGIGTASPGFKLEVNGLAHRVDDASTWTVTSDARLKKNVRDLEGALETLLALRGVTFEYKDPARSGLRRGFLAQEVEQVLPEWVEEGSDGFKRLTIDGFEALAVEALRAQQRALEAQRAEIADLRAEVERLGRGQASPASR